MNEYSYYIMTSELLVEG